MLLSRNILRFCPKLELMSCSQYRFKSLKSMKQVDVDDLELQAHLGKLQMGMIRKAEKEKNHDAKKHVKYRKKDWYVAGFCFATIIVFSVFDEGISKICKNLNSHDDILRA